MNPPESLFPFPPFPPEKKEESPSPSAAFSPDEMRDLRAMLEIFRNGKLAGASSGPSEPHPGPVTPPISEQADPFGTPPLPSSSPVVSETKTGSDSRKPEPGGTDFRESCLRFLETRSSSTPWEQEIKAALKSILSNISSQSQFVPVFSSISGVFPMREFLRHGTPEQKLFALNAAGDRFLQTMSGIGVPQRKELLKLIGRSLSESSEQFSFLAMEGEPFQTQFHERVDGSSPSGRVVKEMRGYLVTRKNSEQIVRLGRVLT